MPAAQPELRATRRRELVAATRKLFDARGAADVPVEEVAREAGIARGLIYRQFASKEELVVLTVAGYLAELARELECEPPLDAIVRRYAAFCARYPAFLDGQILLMRRPADELRALVDAETWEQLGAAMAGCLGPLVDAVRAEGTETPELTANLLWTQMLGAMHLHRLGVGVTRDDDGTPTLFRPAPQELVDACVRSAQATVRQ